MDNNLKLLKHAKKLIDQNGCSCEFSHSRCGTMAARRGKYILDLVITAMEEGIELPLDIKTRADIYCANLDLIVCPD